MQHSLSAVYNMVVVVVVVTNILSFENEFSVSRIWHTWSVLDKILV